MTDTKVQQIELVELAGRVQSFNLPHQQYCADGRCSCTPVEIPTAERDQKTGNTVRSFVRRRRPKSITLTPHGKSKPLHVAALQCREIQIALHATPRRVRYDPVK